MEINEFYQTLLVLLLCCPIAFISFFGIGLGIRGILAKRRFIKKAQKVRGKVVGRLQAKNRAQERGGYFTGEIAETYSKHILILEFETLDGDIYSVQTEKAYSGKVNSLPVFYNPDDINDLMIDGFYKKGSSAFTQLTAGLIMGTIFLILILAAIKT